MKMPTQCLGAALALLVALHAAPSQAQMLLDPLSYSGLTLDLKLYSNPTSDRRIISMTSQPGDNQSLYVTAQNGAVMQVDQSGNSTEWFNYNDAINDAFNTPSGLTLTNTSSAHGGLRSVAYHPEFESNGKFYTSAMVGTPNSTAGINYLGGTINNAVSQQSVVAEWTYNHNTGQVESNSYRELFRVQMPVFDHPIKQIAFNNFAKPGDEDYGLLYITHGDGSDQQASSSGGGLMTDNALGKVLRINPLQDGSNAYTTPNNPFVNDSNTLDEIYTLGHRNPHHITFGQASDGSSYAIIGEVGRNNIEEVNVLRAGGNYGWSEREGTFVHKQDNGGYINGVEALPADEWMNDFVYPAAQYEHLANPGTSGHSSAITGGLVVDILDGNGDVIEEDEYLYLDFGGNSGHFFHSDLNELLSAKTELADGESPDLLTQADSFLLNLRLDSDGDGDIDTTADNINSLLGLGRNDARFGRGPNGEIFISSKQGDGLVYIITNAVAASNSVPEPSTCVMLLAGMAGAAAVRRRRV